MKVSLVVEQGKQAGLEIPLRGSEFFIGRDPRCQLKPASDLVSKLHCCIAMGTQVVTVRDLGSTNGTFVNGDRIEKPTRMANGDILKIGPLQFRLSVAVEVATAGKRHDEDDLMDALMEGAGPAVTPMEETTMEDAQPPIDAAERDTVQDRRIISAETTTSIPKQPTPNKPDAKPDAPKRDTREAASDILSRYFVRKRG